MPSGSLLKGENDDEGSPSTAPLWRRIGAAAHGLGRAALDFALPPQCLACSKPVTGSGGLCVACWRDLRPIERPFCERTGAPFPADFGPGLVSPAAIAHPPSYDRARAVARFDGVARDLVHRLKYADAVHLARPLGAMMARAGHELLAPDALVVPVPLHRGRLWSRRFNQAALLGREAARLAGAGFMADALVRVRATEPQVGLSAAQRADNLAGAFKVADAALLKGRRVVIADDVLTTGATVERLARVVRRAGAQSVDVLVFALVVKDG